MGRIVGPSPNRFFFFLNLYPKNKKSKRPHRGKSSHEKILRAKNPLAFFKGFPKIKLRNKKKKSQRGSHPKKNRFPLKAFSIENLGWGESKKRKFFFGSFWKNRGKEFFFFLPNAPVGGFWGPFFRFSNGPFFVFFFFPPPKLPFFPGKRNRKKKKIFVILFLRNSPT